MIRTVLAGVGLALAGADLARFTVDQLHDDRWVRGAPMLAE